MSKASIAVVIPSFRAAATIQSVLEGIGPEVDRIYVVDDCCPDGTGAIARVTPPDPRVTVLVNPRNMGVGGAMKVGYANALSDGADVIVKLDADGQMDPRHIARLVAPIVAGEADYAKGNRFAPSLLMPSQLDSEALARMPRRRRAANWLLGKVHAFATGYRSVRDPANGYTAIHAKALRKVDPGTLADCFFFETDMLCHLNRIGAVVVEVPVPALYPSSISSLKLRRVALRFARLILVRSTQRAMRRRFGIQWATPAPDEPLWRRLERA